jgi:hypothetical protein
VVLTVNTVEQAITPPFPWEANTMIGELPLGFVLFIAVCLGVAGWIFHLTARSDNARRDAIRIRNLHEKL